MVKLGFVTCVKLGLNCMEELYSCGENLEVVFTLKDNLSENKSGRVYLDDFCNKHSIPLYKVSHINDSEVITILEKYSIDWLFIIGWSQVANKFILQTPKLGALGMHPTLLPKGRGRASIPWAIIKGYKQTGVSLFKLDEGVDTGPLIDQSIIEIEPKEDAYSLYQKVLISHQDLIKRFIKLLKLNNIQLINQDNDLASYWQGRKPEDGEINLKGTVEEAEVLVRATTKPYPGAFFYRENIKFKVWKAHIAEENESISMNCIKFDNGTLILDEFSTT